MRIHIGCGGKHLPGYVSVDADPRVVADYTASATDLPFDDNVARTIYACHVLEHIPKPHVMATLTEWKRVLRLGGLLRVSVPDFSVLCKLYTQSLPLWRVINPIMGGQVNEFDVHYTLWDEHYLSWHLTQIGFQNIQEWNPRKVHPPDFKDYSSYTVAGVPISLNLQGEST